MIGSHIHRGIVFHNFLTIKAGRICEYELCLIAILKCWFLGASASASNLRRDPSIGRLALRRPLTEKRPFPSSRIHSNTHRDVSVAPVSTHPGQVQCTFGRAMSRLGVVAGSPNAQKRGTCHIYAVKISRTLKSGVRCAKFPHTLSSYTRLQCGSFHPRHSLHSFRFLRFYRPFWPCPLLPCPISIKAAVVMMAAMLSL